MKEGIKLNNLRTDHVTIRSELRYLIGAKIVDLKWRVFGENPLQRSGSGSEPDSEPNREFGPVANTTQDAPPKIVDADFQNGALTVLFSVLPKKAASTLIMESSGQVTFQLQYIQDQKSLTLR